MSKDLELQVRYWHESAARNLKTAVDLLKLNHRDACLFFCHLALEKLLKGLVVKHTGEFAPLTHDLAKLSHLAALKFDGEEIQHLRTITTFNIAGRYDDIKLAFYKKCTSAFTKKYLSITQELFLCIEEQYQNK